MVSDKLARIGKTTKGNPVVITTPDEKYPDGVVFYNNNRVQNVRTKAMGTWSCVGGEAVVKESINEVVSRILREKLLNEQITDTLMDGYVDTAVDDLDGYVAEYNLKSLKNILLKLKGKTYNGKDAISEFLRYYSADERGDDFISDVESVGIANLSVTAKNMKEEIIKIASGQSNVSNVIDVPNVQTPLKRKSRGLNEQTSVDIVWDGTKKSGETEPIVKKKKKQSQFHDCEGKDFPLEYGCKSSKVKEIQKCLGVTDDGLFGRDTMKAMVDNKYDTSRGLSKDVYDAIKGNCNQETQRTKLEPIEPIATRGLKMGDLTPKSIKLPDLSRLIQSNQQPKDLYLALKDAGYIRGDANETTLEDGTVLPPTNRVKFKGPDLDEETLGRLDTILSGMGYDRIKQRLDKSYGDKYVWLKQ